MAMANDDDIEAAYREEALASLQVSAEVDEACDCKPESSSEDESESSSEPRLKVWWARLLHSTAGDLRLPWDAPKDHLRIMTSCTGCSAESAVLKASWVLVIVLDNNGSLSKP